MLCGRSAFGCALSKALNVIVVAGGYIAMNTLTNRCEIYNIMTDQWIELAPMTSPKCSTSLCITPNGHVYSFGGLCKKDYALYLSNKIEILDIITPNSIWKELSIQLPVEGVDFGTIVRRNGE